jgi:hypothetical protein
VNLVIRFHTNESEDGDMPDTEVRDLELERSRGEIQEEVLISTLMGPNQAHETAATSLREWSNAFHVLDAQLMHFKLF